MSRRDGTGPMGAGSMTGKGLGFCTNKNSIRYGTGPGMGLGRGLARRGGFGGGFGRGFAINQNSIKIHKDLREQKELLQNRLEAIDKQLENI